MESCWDDDSDARLTSHCVEQRLKSLIESPPDCTTFEPQFLDLLKDSADECSTCSDSDSNTVVML